MKPEFKAWLNLIVFGLSLIILLTPTRGAAQESAFLPSESPVYELVERLQRRGHLTDLNPTLRPYTYRELRSSLDKVNILELKSTETEWLAQLQAILGTSETTRDFISRFGVSASMSQSSSRRYDPLRPLGSTYYADPRAEFTAVLGWQQVVAASGITHDMYYDRDPDGLDVVNRFFMRGENSYIGYSSRYFDLHIGRFGTHWNRYGAEAPLIGDDVRQYDKIAFRIGSERLSLRSVYGELDNLDSVGVFSGRGFKSGNVRRFVFAHRVDWKPTNGLTLTLYEGDLVSGESAGLSLKYLQPLHVVFFESDNTPKNFENNLMVGGGIHFQREKISASAQFILDDIVILNRKTVKEEGRLEPATSQTSVHVTFGGIKPNLDLGFSGSLVSSLSYRTDQKAGQWSYAQRSLGMQFTDYAHMKIFADWYVDHITNGLTLKPALHVLAQGTGDFRSDFEKSYSDGRLLPAFLSGKETMTVRPAIGIDYRFYNVWTSATGTSQGWEIYFTADFGFNVTKNVDHTMGQNSVEFHNVARLRFKRGF